MDARRLTSRANATSCVSPCVRTVSEAGLSRLEMLAWFGLFAPKGTPKEIVAKLNAAVVDALATPNIQERLVGLGQEIPPRDQKTPEALAAFHRAEVEKWWPIIKSANIKGE